MKLSEAIAGLQVILDKEGDIEMTCTGCMARDVFPACNALDEPFETTADNFVIGDHPTIGRRVRVVM